MSKNKPTMFLLLCFVLLSAIPTALCVGNTTTGSNYQDAEWAQATALDATIVSNDLDNLANATANFDLPTMAIYANSLFKDTKKALNNSDLYTVSPDLQATKTEQRLAMVDANWGAYYNILAIDEFNKGNTANGTYYLSQGTASFKSCGEKFEKATELLKIYNSKKR